LSLKSCFIYIRSFWFTESPDLPTEESILIGIVIGIIITVLCIPLCILYYLRRKTDNNNELVNEETNWSAANPVFSPKIPGTEEARAREPGLRNAVSRDPEANVPETKVPEYREHETKA
jgi:hypothetical protein